jgi:AcrR family transcriptional regulator
MRLQLKHSATAEKIALAAGQLFARQGYHGTSTREIARLADVSENTLFRHFDHKEDLFWSALREQTSGLKLRRDVLEGLTQCDSPEVVLPKVFEALTDTVKFRPDLLRLLAVAFLELHWKADDFCDEHLSPFLSVINRYLAANIKSGKLRNLDSTIVTAALTLTTLMHPGVSRMIDGSKSSYSDSREAGRAYSRFWLDVLSPKMLTYQLPAPSVTAEDVR